MMGIFAVIVALLYFFPRINFFIKWAWYMIAEEN
jgi:hypothetical protein